MLLDTYCPAFVRPYANDPERATTLTHDRRARRAGRDAMLSTHDCQRSAQVIWVDVNDAPFPPTVEPQQPRSARRCDDADPQHRTRFDESQIVVRFARARVELIIRLAEDRHVRDRIDEETFRRDRRLGAKRPE